MKIQISLYLTTNSIWMIIKLQFLTLKNSIILTNAEGTKKIQTRVFEVIDFGEGKTDTE